MDMKRFIGKVVIVTGAGNGIGLVIANKFAAEGAKVIVADINDSAGERTAKEIINSGGIALSITTDVSDEKQIKTMVEKVLNQFGQIDILVNNAGISIHKLLIELEREAWDRQIEVQLTGPFLTTKHVGRQMIAQGKGGKIVNISSIASLMGRIKAGPHCASKGGLNMLTKVAAMELAKYDINVNAVAPGLIDVPAQRDEKNLSEAYKNSYMKEVPLRRMGLPSDISNMVLFLSSSEAEWITGQLFLVDGGLMSGNYSFRGTHDFTMLYGHDIKRSTLDSS
jgi:NAD(P)-dependent dehydrogenase (short-subunit alcohol dehydrogenase family)